MFTDLATYIDETKEYLWKGNDTALEAALPKIIRQAEARIRTDLKIQAEEVTLYVDITENPYQLPTDCATLRTLVWDQYGPSTYTTPRDFSRATSAPILPGGISDRQNSANLLEHTIEGQRLRHRMNVSPTAPMSARLIYAPRAGSITDTTPDLSLYNSYEDMFDFAVYAYALLWLNDEQRAGAFDQRYLERLDAALGEEQYRRYGEGPLKKQMPRKDIC